MAHTRVAIADGIMTLTLNRPEVMNAYTDQMGQEIAAAFDQASADDAVRVVVVTGEGRAFCAGADVSAGADTFDEGAETMFGDRSGPRRPGGFIAAIAECKKPSIAAINGGAAGVGINLTLPMDIRIIAETARVGFVFTRRGLVPEAGSSWYLPRIVGMSQALHWCLTGRVFNADEALKGGLVSEVVPKDALLARAYEIAREIAENTSAVAVALTRQLFWRHVPDNDSMAASVLETRLNMELGKSDDAKEGITAFLEKRPPQFKASANHDLPPACPWWHE
jgi:enoyl-CoA hydratase/carnithine racemase